MNRKILLVLCSVALLLPGSVKAQNSDYRFGVSLSGGPFEYNGDYGNGFFFGRAPIYYGINYGLGYYINSSFDATLFGSVGDIGWRDKGTHYGFRSRISSIMLGARYKLNNGTILDEDSKFRGHIVLGYGGMQSVSTINANDPDAVTGHRTWYAAQWAGGICLKYNVWDNIDIQYELNYNYVFDDNIDGKPYSTGPLTRKGLMEAYLTHGIGVTYNFNMGGEGPVRITEEDNSVPKEIQAKVDSAAATIEFETNSSTIKEDSYEDLDSIAAILVQYPAMNVYIEGHTDNVGAPDYNMQLSQERAEAVKDYLADKGVSKKRLEAEGFGDTQPIEKNDTEEGRAANRRVQVKLYYK